MKALGRTVSLLVVCAALAGSYLAYTFASHISRNFSVSITSGFNGRSTHMTTTTTSYDRSLKYLGVREPSSSYYSSVNAFSRAVGHKVNLVLFYTNWGHKFPLWFADEAHSHNAIPVVGITPGGVSLADIAAGKYDSYIIAFADAVHNYGHPVFMGFAHEMNGWWYRWGYKYTPPHVWVAAWRHIVTVFREQGAKNAKWIWTINRGGPKGSDGRPQVLNLLPSYWPGASYVDMVGIDGYYFRKGETFNRDFGSTIRKVRTITHKPIMLRETAIGQVDGQAATIPDLFKGISRYHLIGLIWYDVPQHQGIYHQDWRLEGHPAALEEFHKWVNKIWASGQ